MLHLDKKHNMCWCVCYHKGTLKQFNDSFHTHAKNNINSLKMFSLTFLQKEARASFRPSQTVHTTKRHKQNEGKSAFRKKGTQCLSQKSKDPDKPAQLKRARRSRSFSPYFLTTTPLLSCHSPCTVREQHSCRDSRPLGSITRLPGLMHFLAQHVQGHVATQSHSNPARKERSCHQAHTTR